LQDVAASRRKSTPWNRWPVRAAAALVVCAAAIAVLMRVNQRAELSRHPQVTDRPAVNAPDSGRGTIVEVPVNVVLLADVQRSGTPQVVRVAPGATQVRLQAEAPSSDSSLSYRLSIMDEAGAPLFSASDLRPLQSGGYVFVEVAIPGATLGVGRRAVTLAPRSPGAESFTWQVDVQPAN
jgi:hypothetical protein